MPCINYQLLHNLLYTQLILICCFWDQKFGSGSTFTFWLRISLKAEVTNVRAAGQPCSVRPDTIWQICFQTSVSWNLDWIRLFVALVEYTRERTGVCVSKRKNCDAIFYGINRIEPLSSANTEQVGIKVHLPGCKGFVSIQGVVQHKLFLGVLSSCVLSNLVFCPQQGDFTICCSR